MRPLTDPQVQELAVHLEATCVVPWPEEYSVPKHCCAMLQVLDRTNVALAHNPGHECPEPDRMFLHAATVVLDYLERGPDEGWDGLDSGRGHVTHLSDRVAGQADPLMHVPGSERYRP